MYAIYKQTRTLCVLQYSTKVTLFCLQDLSNYKYDTMISKSLSLLNKYYSAKTRLFKMAVQAQVSITIALLYPGKVIFKMAVLFSVYLF